MDGSQINTESSSAQGLERRFAGGQWDMPVCLRSNGSLLTLLHVSVRGECLQQDPHVGLADEEDCCTRSPPISTVSRLAAWIIGVGTDLLPLRLNETKAHS